MGVARCGAHGAEHGRGILLKNGDTPRAAFHCVSEQQQNWGLSFVDACSAPHCYGMTYTRFGVNRDVNRMARVSHRLTSAKLQKYPIGIWHDGAGLYLQVTGPKQRSWFYRYALNGKERRMGLGALSKYNGLAEARQKAADARKLLDSNIDPIEHRKAQRATEAKQSAIVTFDQAVTQYLTAHESEWKHQRHAERWRSTLSRYASPYIGRLSLADIDSAAVLRV